MGKGRPTKYNPSIITKLDEYLSTTGREQTELPTREGFALYIDVDDETLIEWEKIYPDFSATIKRLDSQQKNQLMNDGLYGGKEVNSSMAIFLLKANHNMVETEKKLFGNADGETFRIVIGNGVQGHQPVLPDKDTPGPAGSVEGSGEVQGTSMREEMA